jgi:hypothetical protein
LHAASVLDHVNLEACWQRRGFSNTVTGPVISGVVVSRSVNGGSGTRSNTGKRRWP